MLNRCWRRLISPVKLAGQSWSDQMSLPPPLRCSCADASLADMNDPSLITARRAITDDIASLSSVAQIDYDGIISNSISSLTKSITCVWRITIPMVPPMDSRQQRAVQLAKRMAR